MDRHRKPYPTEHARDVWDAPEITFIPSISLSAGPAAEFLGLPKDTLIRWADDLGLTVLRRHPHDWRYFLISELKEIKRRMEELDILDLAELGRYPDAIPIIDQDRKKRRWSSKAKGC